MGETCLKLHSQNRTGTYNGIWFYAVSYLISIILVGSFNQYTFNIRMCGDWWMYAYVVSTLVLVVFVTQCTRQIWINFPISTFRMREITFDLVQKFGFWLTNECINLNNSISKWAQLFNTEWLTEGTGLK